MHDSKGSALHLHLSDSSEGRREKELKEDLSTANSTIVHTTQH